MFIVGRGAPLSGGVAGKKILCGQGAEPGGRGGEDSERVLRARLDVLDEIQFVLSACYQWRSTKALKKL